MAAMAVPVLLGAVASTILSKVMAPDPVQQQQQAAPVTAAPVAAPTPTAMPTANNDAVMAAHQKAIKERAAAQGRASTILSNSNTAPSDKLGA